MPKLKDEVLITCGVCATPLAWLPVTQKERRPAICLGCTKKKRGQDYMASVLHSESRVEVYEALLTL